MERHLLFVRSCVQTCAAAAATAGQPPGCGAPQQQRVEGALSPAAGADAALPLPASTRSQGSRVAPGLQDCPRKLLRFPVWQDALGPGYSLFVRVELGGGSAAVNLPLPYSPGSVHALQGNGEFCRETKAGGLVKDTVVSPARERGAEQTSVEPIRLWMLGYQEQMDQSSLTKSVQMLRCHTRARHRAVATCCRPMEITASVCPESQSRLCGYGTNCAALPESLCFCLEEELRVVAAKATAVLCCIYLNGDTEGWSFAWPWSGSMTAAVHIALGRAYLAPAARKVLGAKRAGGKERCGLCLVPALHPAHVQPQKALNRDKKSSLPVFCGCHRAARCKYVSRCAIAISSVLQEGRDMLLPSGRQGYLHPAPYRPSLEAVIILLIISWLKTKKPSKHQHSVASTLLLLLGSGPEARAEQQGETQACMCCLHGTDLVSHRHMHSAGPALQIPPAVVQLSSQTPVPCRRAPLKAPRLPAVAHGMSSCGDFTWTFPAQDLLALIAVPQGICGANGPFLRHQHSTAKPCSRQAQPGHLHAAGPPLLQAVPVLTLGVTKAFTRPQLLSQGVTDETNPPLLCRLPFLSWSFLSEGGVEVQVLHSPAQVELQLGLQGAQDLPADTQQSFPTFCSKELTRELGTLHPAQASKHSSIVNTGLQILAAGHPVFAQFSSC
ncbi:hypothetical protein Anapl_09190 [Anas platyrhynchos]|uniref:Uncharacterized protein n=1 Tax=Anas platyrhynchos TaxID=8839 RepID=R0KMV5_ANAPL|nr:hypothetical protein Anapl_09190 [Anas platyrhynchos]